MFRIHYICSPFCFLGIYLWVSVFLHYKVFYCTNYKKSDIFTWNALNCFSMHRVQYNLICKVSCEIDFKLFSEIFTFMLMNEFLFWAPSGSWKKLKQMLLNYNSIWTLNPINKYLKLVMYYSSGKAWNHMHKSTFTWTDWAAFIYVFSIMYMYVSTCSQILKYISMLYNFNVYI